MSGRNTPDIDSGIARATRSFIVSGLKWALLLNAVIGWIAFWLNLVRLHLSMGNTTDAVVTSAVAIGPIAVAVLWWGFQRIRLDSPATGFIRG